jgi:hypothetical protein
MKTPDTKTATPTADQRDLVMKLAEGFRLPAAQRVHDVAIPLSVIIAVVRSSLETHPFFPPNSRPEQLGDGAVIERRGKHHFRVHERHEIGQLRFSEPASRFYFSLRGAVLRYLKHYRPDIDRVRINRWS